MRIRTQQYVYALTAAAALSIIAATLFYAAGQTGQAIARSEFAGRIVAEGISGLRLVAVEYILYRQPRAQQQWEQRNQSLTRLLATDDLRQDPAEQAILETLRQRHQEVRDIFSRLVALPLADRGADERQKTLTREVERRLVTQFLIATQDMVSEATRLARLSHARLSAAQRRTNQLIALFAAVVGLVVVVASLVLTGRQILAPIRQIERTVKRFGQDDLTYRCNLTIQNELGDLARAFDQMAARLAETNAALERQTAQLQDANRELESFSYSVSHDLRAPLRGIDGWSLALVEDYGEQLNETARGYLNLVRSEAQRMGQLIDDLLRLSRLNRGELRCERVDLSALAREVVERLQQTQPKRPVEWVIAPNLQVEGDARLLDIALTNLLGNAWKFTGPRPAARIELSSRVETDPATRTQRIVFFVRDNGVGFDMTYAQKLFGTFQRLHSAHDFPGAGIGLATVQRIVRRHQGRVWAEAQPGQGATFYFTLKEAA